MIAAKQNTSIFKEGIEFENNPTSTGDKIVYLPKRVNKYNTVFTDYDKKKEKLYQERLEREHQ